MDHRDAQHDTERIDTADLKFFVVISVIGLTAFLVKNNVPSAGINRYILDIIGSFCCMLYVLPRARAHPWKLDDWGLTSKLSPAGWLGAVGLLVLAFVGPAVITLLFGGSLTFKLSMITDGLGYAWSAFAQEFILCSIAANALAKTKTLRGVWRVPILAGALFGLAHLLPEGFHWPHTPFMMAFTALMGFTVTFYFLKFRNLWPIVALHAIGFPMAQEWLDPLLRGVG